jgi:hypothetical protein
MNDRCPASIPTALAPKLYFTEFPPISLVESHLTSSLAPFVEALVPKISHPRDPRVTHTNWTNIFSVITPASMSKAIRETVDRTKIHGFIQVTKSGLPVISRDITRRFLETRLRFAMLLSLYVSQSLSTFLFAFELCYLLSNESTNG